MPSAKGGSKAQSPQTWQMPRYTWASRGEWPGQCSINKKHSFKPPGPQDSGGRGLTETGSGSSACHRGKREQNQPCPQPGPCPLSALGTGKVRARCWGLIQLRPIQSATEQPLPAPGSRHWGGSCHAASAADSWYSPQGTVHRVPSSTTCPGPPGAAVPRSSRRSAVTSGSSPPLQSDTPRG